MASTQSTLGARITRSSQNPTTEAEHSESRYKAASCATYGDVTITTSSPITQIARTTQLRNSCYSLAAVRRITAALDESAELRALVGGCVDAELLDTITRIIRGIVPRSVPADTLRESLEWLRTLPFTEVLRSQLVLLLGGNIPRLNYRLPVTPWRGQRTREAVPVRVERVTPTQVGKRQRPAVELRLRVLCGSCVGLQIVKLWPTGYCRMLAPSLGFTKPWGAHPFTDGQQLAGLLFAPIIDPELSVRGPEFEQLWQVDDKIHPTGLWTRNRELIRRRGRHGVGNDAGCEWREMDRIQCHQCPVGLDQCELATHTVSYVRKKCSLCDESQQLSWFDPELSEHICRKCELARRRDVD